MDVLTKTDLIVVKRNGKKVDFDGNKIALAIKKGFENITVLNEAMEDGTIYTEKDVNKVYVGVIKRINKEYKDSDKIKIEDIQDLIEVELNKQGYDKVCDSFAEYRERRAKSREMFFDDKKRHKFLKTLEGLGLKSANEDDTKRENANIDGDSAMGTMLQYGSTVSKEFAKAYLMKKKFADAHDSGDIHIHDMDFLAMGTTTCMQIELDRLFKKGFSTGHGHLRTPNDILSYSALAAIAIQSNQNDQHGGQSIPAFDYYMAPGVLKTFKKQFKQHIYDYLDYQDLLSFVNFDKAVKEIDKLTNIEFDIDIFESIYKDSKEIKRLFEKSYEKALQKTDRTTYQAMEAFIHNLNTMHSRAGAQVPFSSINFGTDTSACGRMVIKNFLLATEAGLGKGETPIFPVSIFKVKEGINYNKEDPNYDLFKLACKTSAKRLFPNFSFLDAPFNIPFYRKGEPKTEVGYMGCRTRVMTDVTDPSNETTGGRGNLSFTSINLPRIAIKHGSLTIGFIGLAETLTALIGKHHGESEEAQKLGLEIIGFMRNKANEFAEKYNLNFTLIATPAEGLSGRFVNIDKAIYGKIKGITDKDYYTNSVHVPVSYNISIKDKIEKEAPYHALTNGGHISYIELDGDTVTNVNAFESVIRIMKEAGIGYGAINHPVDRDPVCGYVGIIKDVCPKCGRREGEGVSLEKITSLECECGR